MFYMQYFNTIAIQQGLMDAFSKVVPNADVRYCCRHIWANFKLNFSGAAFKSLFSQAARAGTKAMLKTLLLIWYILINNNVLILLK